VQPSEVLAGSIEPVTFHSAQGGMGVLRIKARDHRDLVTVMGHAVEIRAGSAPSVPTPACMGASNLSRAACDAPLPLTAASLLGLKATVLLLITLLIKARIQIKLASALGLFLLALQTCCFWPQREPLAWPGLAACDRGYNC